MKIKLYCITYNDNDILNQWFLESLYLSNYDKNNVDIFIIDNHSNISIDSKYNNLITIIPNTLRPNFSTGHLSRSWNQTIINGFVDLNNPDCDLVVACQVDTVLKKDWFDKIYNLPNKEFCYISEGAGDQFQIFTPESIKNIGIYDERFCSIGLQEGDYFLRALLNYSNNSSINDYYHERVLNPIGNENEFIFIENTVSGFHRKSMNHDTSYHSYNIQLFRLKWTKLIHMMNDVGERWKDIFILSNSHFKPNIPNFMYYPYFEKNINITYL